jgi:outer membrane lipoprotein carrier protein
VIKPDAIRNSWFALIWRTTVCFGVLTIVAMAASRASAVVTAAGEPPELRDLLARLQRHYQETRSFSAKFNETITRPGAPTLNRGGTLSWLRPGRIRFDYGAPQPETVVSDGRTLYDYDPGLNQVIETPLKNAIRAQAAAALLLGVGNLERDFTATRPEIASQNRLSHVILTPKSGGPSIEIGVDPSTSNIVTLMIADALGNRTEFHFSEIRQNVALTPADFVFKTPDGADVVTSSGGA